MFRYFRFAILLMAGLVVSACSGQADQASSKADIAAQSVFKPVVNYTNFALIPNCREEAVRVVRYHACRDSRQLYDAALAKAKSQGRPLMVTFGFNKCPYCKVLEAEIHNPSAPLTSEQVTQYFSNEAKVEAPFELLTLRLHARSDHGLKLADELGVTQMAQARGWHRVWSPFVIFVNPDTGAMASESLWEAKEIHCDWAANIAVSLENIDMLARGDGGAARKRCPKA
ncbi:MAG: thioredoxin family protein [Litorimonas sp.]